MNLVDLLKVIADSSLEICKDNTNASDVRVVLDTGSPDSDYGVVYDIEHAQLRYNEDRGDYILVLYGNE